MSETSPGADQPKGDSAPNYPSNAFFPVVFADGCQSGAWGGGVVKFYLNRYDPSFDAIEPAKREPVVQIVTSTPGFIAMTLFFQRMLDRMVADGATTQAAIDEMHKAISDAATE
jgi:hypothetical protein